MEDIACLLVEKEKSQTESLPTRFLYEEARLAVPGTDLLLTLPQPKSRTSQGKQQDADKTYCRLGCGACLPYGTLAIWVDRHDVTGYTNSTGCGDTGKGKSGPCTMWGG